MNVIYTVLVTFTVFFTYATFVTLLRWDYWWVRIFDFPRLQIGVLLILTLVSSFLIYDFTLCWQYLLVILLLMSIVYQAGKIYRYTIFAKKQVLSYTGEESENSFSLIVSNVFQPNRKSERLIELVNKYSPDLLLILEADQWWEEQMENVAQSFPFRIKKPQDNLYGMVLYSKLRLSDEKINFLFDDEIPSFEAWVNLTEKNKFRIFCLHPKPPFPTESATSTDRDAELLIVGKKVLNSNEPVLIFGDFNDVAWSNTTRLFQKISKMLDPRIGRGFFNTFHSKYPLFRWSLDHVFHSSHFKLLKIKRLKDIGSDHFPIYIKLHYIPEEKTEHEEPEADPDEQQLAEEKIEKAS